MLSKGKSGHTDCVQPLPTMAEVKLQRYLKIGIVVVVSSEVAYYGDIHIHFLADFTMEGMFRLLAGLYLSSRELPFEGGVWILGLPAFHAEDMPLVHNNGSYYMVVHCQLRI